MKSRLYDRVGSTIYPMSERSKFWAGPYSAWRAPTGPLSTYRSPDHPATCRFPEPDHSETSADLNDTHIYT